MTNMTDAYASSLYDVKDKKAIGDFWRSSYPIDNNTAKKFLIKQIGEMLEKESSSNKSNMQNPIDKDLHKLSTKVMEDIFEKGTDDSLIE